ncbi:MAG: TSUP family transporter [Elusimicrobia bacterium]|nr:TSUP family transporter [Elusimicrobiota bacterium]MBD3412074.1 TSUP family transporter [Elusimicrobiota bacterium]
MTLVMTLLAMAAGIASGLFGIGGGVILVPLLHYVYKLNIHAAVGTSLAIIVPTALVGSIWHLHYGHVELKLVGILALATILGGFIGAFVTPYISGPFLRRGFAVFLIIVAVRMFMK